MRLYDRFVLMIHYILTSFSPRMGPDYVGVSFVGPGLSFKTH